MPFYPWMRLRQLFKQPWTPYVVVFALNYLCNDISAAVQKQGFGLITFVPYMALLSILTVNFVFSWIKAVKRQEPLPRHMQDIQMTETRQAEVMQVGQTHTPSLSRQREFKTWPRMVNEEVEDAATGIKQQMGERSESQRLSNDAKDEVADVKRPQQSVSTTKDNCTEAQVWKSSLATGSSSRGGGSTSIGAEIATTGNKRDVHMESTRHNDAAIDATMESKNPQQHRSPSKNKQSQGSGDGSKDEVMKLKDCPIQKSSSRNKQSTVTRGGSINSDARVPITGSQKLAQTESTSPSNEAKDELIEPENPHLHRSSSKNKQSTASRDESIKSGAGVASTEHRRSANTESTSRKDDVTGGLESENLQKRRSFSKNKCVSRAH